MWKKIGKQKINSLSLLLTFLATKRTTTRATAKQPAAILAVRRFVDESIKTIPQNDDPRSGCKKRIIMFA